MNIHDPNVTVPKVTTGPLPASRKVYCAPDAAPELRVPVREIIARSERRASRPLPVYDTTGPTPIRTSPSTWKRASPAPASNG